MDISMDMDSGNFSCHFCDYKSNRKFNRDRHIKKKHQNSSVSHSEAFAAPELLAPINWSMTSSEVEETVEMEQTVQLFGVVNMEPEEEENRDSDYNWQTLAFEKKNFFQNLGGDIQVPSDIVKAYPDICLFKLYNSVNAQGGYDRNVDWDVVAICCSLLGFPPEELKSLYASLLLPFERVEAPKTRELNLLGIPVWWDCGEYISPTNPGVPFRSYPFSKRTVAAVMHRVYQKYYITSPSRHDFRVKDSWIYICGYNPDRFIKILTNFK